MAIERESLVDAVLAAAGVIVLIAGVVVAASVGGEQLDRQGTFFVIGGIVTFLLAMAGIGFYISTKD